MVIFRRNFLLSSAAILALAALDSRSTASAARASYKFSRVHPPLLDQFKGDILGVPDSELSQTIGSTKWDTHTSVPTADGKFLNTDIKYEMVRRNRWALVSMPVRYSVDRKIKTTQVVGWSKTDKETMEKSLGVEAGAKVFGISLTAKADLKLTSDVTNEWHEETTTEVDMEFKGGHIYCAWRLYDELDLITETKISTDAADQPATGNPIAGEAIFRNVVSIYEDSAPDTNGALFNSVIESFNASTNTIMSGPPRQD